MKTNENTTVGFTAKLFSIISMNPMKQKRNNEHIIEIKNDLSAFIPASFR
jgi:hypothetical protein